MGAARRSVGEQLDAWRLPAELCADAALLMSELATNAVLHTLSARILCGMGLMADGFLHIEVHDDDPVVRHLSRSRPGPDDETGRGLVIVQEIADRWGIERSARTRGNAVWANLRTTP
ncbi:ATP-binding protein [Streptomyces sp. NPDC007205]|uniref:ATP-binding protein n=1 Tax=Streptomyces sp. NPDC007205 TaxID=3154316 RepID=UPI0033E9AACD